MKTKLVAPPCRVEGIPRAHNRSGRGGFSGSMDSAVGEENFLSYPPCRKEALGFSAGPAAESRISAWQSAARAGILPNPGCRGSNGASQGVHAIACEDPHQGQQRIAEPYAEHGDSQEEREAK